MNRYDVKSILESSTLPVGGAARRLKEAAEHPEAGAMIWRAGMDGGSVISQLTGAGMSAYAPYHHHHHQSWPTIAFQHASPLSVHYPYVAQPYRGWCKPEQDAHSLQDLQQLHLGAAAHNFLQPSSSSTVYNGGGHLQGLGGNAFYMLPASTVVAETEQGQSSTATYQGSTCSYGEEEGTKLTRYDAMAPMASASADPYAAPSTVSVASANGCSNNWSSPFNGMG
jgi:AP2-like factor (ANT lineage)